jgi:hypothetical protein
MAQEQYWQLSEQEIDWRNERRPWMRLVKRTIWGVRWWFFRRQHQGESFKCFRPEWIKRAVSDKVEAWVL